MENVNEISEKCFPVSEIVHLILHLKFFFQF